MDFKVRNWVQYWKNDGISGNKNEFHAKWIREIK